MSRKSIFTVFLLIFICHTLHASLRTDLAERTREEVLAKAVQLGRTLPWAQAVGAVVLNEGEDVATGIALDHHTILTAAHFNYSKPDARITFILSTNAQGQYIQKAIDPTFDCEVYEIDRDHMYGHESFKTQDPDHFILDSKYPLDQVGALDKEMILDGMRFKGIPLKDLGGLSFEACKDIFLSSSEFCGVDLLILKTKKPLPEELAYSHFLSQDVAIDKINGASIGFGYTLYNDHPNAPYRTSENPLEQNQRHVISCNVSSAFLEGGSSIFYGAYEALFINGDHSFIPKSEMLMTAGLPVGGDSGGPLFIKEGDTYVLSGIMSFTLSPFDKIIVDPKLRSLLDTIKQPIFPVWQDVRPYLPWIKSHMEK
ncbi:MAG: hypothetical protein H2057_08180 [Alphaproteobacteria bacterium]|nr:hypothetical protein [Alphaproteobacteria bacterium]